MRPVKCNSVIALTVVLFLIAACGKGAGPGNTTTTYPGSDSTYFVAGMRKYHHDFKYWDGAKYVGQTTTDTLLSIDYIDNTRIVCCNGTFTYSQSADSVTVFAGTDNSADYNRSVSFNYISKVVTVSIKNHVDTNVFLDRFKSFN